MTKDEYSELVDALDRLDERSINDLNRFKTNYDDESHRHLLTGIKLGIRYSRAVIDTYFLKTFDPG